MRCEETRDVLEAYFDGELDASASAAVRTHVAECGECGAEFARLTKLRDGVRNGAHYHETPPGLEERVRAELRRAAGQSSNLRGDAPSKQAGWRWMAVAAAVLCAVSVAGNVALLRNREKPVEEAVLDGHVRSLMGTHLLDVPSTDQHTVKPWFDGKLPFAPDVRDFAPEGFPLVGGRTDYVAGRTAAALIYNRRKHVINVFTWPSTGDGGQEELTENGYHLLRWHRGGMEFWAVSDLSIEEMREFEKLWMR